MLRVVGDGSEHAHVLPELQSTEGQGHHEEFFHARTAQQQGPGTTQGQDARERELSTDMVCQNCDPGEGSRGREGHQEEKCGARAALKQPYYRIYSSAILPEGSYRGSERRFCILRMSAFLECRHPTGSSLYSGFLLEGSYGGSQSRRYTLRMSAFLVCRHPTRKPFIPKSLLIPYAVCTRSATIASESSPAATACWATFSRLTNSSSDALRTKGGHRRGHGRGRDRLWK